MARRLVLLMAIGPLACSSDPVPVPGARTPPGDPFAGLAVVSTGEPGRGMAAFDAGAGLQVAIARELSSDVLLVDLAGGDPTVVSATPVGEGPRAICAGHGSDGAWLVTADTSASTITTLAVDVSGDLAVKATMSLPETPRELACGDLDADGQDDVIAVLGLGSDRSIQPLRVEAAGLAPFGAPVAVTGATRAELADVDGDGALDVVVLAEQEGRVFVLRGDARGGLVEAASTSPCASPTAAAVADLDGDGRPDIAVACKDGPVAILAATGGAPRWLPTGGEPYDVCATDLTGDGVPDVAAVDVTRHVATVWLGLGGGELSDGGDHEVPRGPVAMDVADADADGDTDLLVLSYEERAFAVLIDGVP